MSIPLDIEYEPQTLMTGNWTRREFGHSHHLGGSLEKYLRKHVRNGRVEGAKADGRGKGEKGGIWK
tara:strand:- start:262 stop:459 length:198 start_codon:yes stop_codon:yes gene_type:complete